MSETILKSAHESAGAVFDPANPGGWPLHYGRVEPAAVAHEYAALRDGAAVLDLGHRCLLEATGPQRARFLQGMVTNDVAALGAGESCRAALLEARGDVLALLRVVATRDALLIESDASCMARVQQTLEHYRVAAPVRFRLPPIAILGLAGPGVRALLARLWRTEADEPQAAEALAIPTPTTSASERRIRAVEATLADAPVRLVPAPDLGTHGMVLYVSPEAATSVWSALVTGGATPVGRTAFDVIRVEAGLAWWGSEVDEDHLLHETGLVAELCSFTKGCYVGQENVARLEARGAHVNRALRSLRSTHPMRAGTEVRVGSETVGTVTTAGVSPRLGPAAMAYVHRKHFAPGTAVTVDGHEATVGLLPIDQGPRSA